MHSSHRAAGSFINTLTSAEVGQLLDSVPPTVAQLGIKLEA